MGAAVAGSVKFETIKANVRDELDIYVDEPDFIELFQSETIDGRLLLRAVAAGQPQLRQGNRL